MLNALMAALLQAVAGDPQVLPAETQPSVEATATSEPDNVGVQTGERACRVSAPTGSRLGGRVRSCERTQLEENERERTRQNADDFQQRRMRQDTGNNG